MNRSLVDQLAAQATDDILGVPVLDRYRFAELVLRRAVDMIDKEYRKTPKRDLFDAGWEGALAFAQEIVFNDFDLEFEE